jgi:transcriptional regulator with XRE-family HTH domain
MNVGEVMADLRREKELGQKELAAKLNLSIGTISNYENGVHHPDLNTLCRIADLFNVTTDYLLGRTGYRCPPEILKDYIATDYMISSFINMVLSLDQNSQNAITKYAEYLKHTQPKPTKPT